jgi:DNA-binding NarL/FixJ family response regulator
MTRRALGNQTGDVRALLVDDHAMVAESIARMLNASEGVHVAGIATSPDEALRLTQAENPDVVVMDIQIPERSGFDIAADLLRKHPDLRVLFMTGYISDLHVHLAVQFQSGGLVLKNSSMSFLCDAVQRVAAGEEVFCSEAADRIEQDPQTGQWTCKDKPVLAVLTPRQLEVLRLLALGQSVREIARRLHLSEKAVESHKYRMMKQLDIHDRVELARLAIREGLVQP